MRVVERDEDLRQLQGAALLLPRVCAPAASLFCGRRPLASRPRRFAPSAPRRFLGGHAIRIAGQREHWREHKAHCAARESGSGSINNTSAMPLERGAADEERRTPGMELSDVVGDE